MAVKRVISTALLPFSDKEEGASWVKHLERADVGIAVVTIEVASVINLSEALGPTAAGLFIKFTLRPLIL